jgi:hypothetical protein
MLEAGVCWNMSELAAAVVNEIHSRSTGIHLHWRHGELRRSITVSERMAILCELSKGRYERSGLQPLLFRYYPGICPVDRGKTLNIPARICKI